MVMLRPYANAHIGTPVKAPTKPADQIDDGVSQRDRSPEPEAACRLSRNCRPEMSAV